MTTQNAWLTQSPISEPGPWATWLDQVPPDIPSMHAATTELVFHYRAHGDIRSHGFGAERYDEANLRYASDLLAVLHGRDPICAAHGRRIVDRVIGCCRDFTLLFVAIARHHGMPARARVGFATYFEPGWYVDHVVAEVWDEERSGWRLVEAQCPVGFVDASTSAALDVLDLPSSAFLSGPQAWRACRAGSLNPETFVVTEQLRAPGLRSWRRLAYNVVADLAALRKQEMLLWDVFGMLDRPFDDPSVPSAERQLLDAVAAVTVDPAVNPERLDQVADDPRLRVPPTFSSYSPLGGERREVTLRN